MVLVLLISCMVIPLNLALGDNTTDGLIWKILTIILDCLFFIDLILTFNTVIFDSNYN